MSDPAPLVSVIITTHNGAAWLDDTLSSVFAQTYPHLEVVVVDNGSTDGTPGLLARWRDRVAVIQQSNLGLAAARNAGMAATTGELVALLDHDDLWLPDKLARQVAVAQDHPSVGLVIGDVEEFDQEGVLNASLLFPSLQRRMARHPDGVLVADLHRALIRRCLASCPAQTLMRRAVLDELGPFVDSPAQDYDMYLRIAQHRPVAVQPGSTTRWRNHPGSMSGEDTRREFVWTADTLPVLEAHRQRCRGVDRWLVRWSIERLTALRCVRALRLAVAGDPAYAEAFLARVHTWRPSPTTAAARWTVRRLPERLPAQLRRLAAGRRWPAA
ncbi:MAG: glycosyltransferase family 2 protein [Acidimicrobiales bacterium]